MTVRLQTVEYWPAAYLDYEATWNSHGISGFETWLELHRGCCVSFAEFDVSAAFVFKRDEDATAFILKYRKRNEDSIG